ATFTRIEADAIAKDDQGRAILARGRLEALGSRVAHLVIKLPDEVKALRKLEIRLDGTPLNRLRLRAPIPLNRGIYKIEVAAAGRAPLVETVEIARDGETSTLEVTMPDPALPPAPSPSPRPGGPSPAPKGSPVAGIVLLSAGAAALGIGTI